MTLAAPAAGKSGVMAEFGSTTEGPPSTDMVSDTRVDPIKDSMMFGKLLGSCTSVQEPPLTTIWANVPVPPFDVQSLSAPIATEWTTTPSAPSAAAALATDGPVLHSPSEASTTMLVPLVGDAATSDWALASPAPQLVPPEAEPLVIAGSTVGSAGGVRPSATEALAANFTTPTLAVEPSATTALLSATKNAFSHARTVPQVPPLALVLPEKSIT